MILVFLQRLKNIIYTNQGLVILVLVFLLSIIGSRYLNNQLFITDKEKNTKVSSNEEAEIKSPLTIQGPILEKSLPTRLRIPELNINTNFVKPLGLEENKEVGVPDSYTEVGWYENSPTPGEAGPAIVLGHVDSYIGPAVFFYLGKLKPGDDIYITREDGKEAHFVVTQLERYEQDQFPTSKVYGNIDHAGLRLITCSGTYKQGVGRYTHNLVVYAKLVE